MAKNKIKKTDEEVCEVFEVEKDKKTKIIESCGTAKENAQASEKQIKKENAMLRDIFIIMGIIVLFFLGIFLGAKFLKGFEYQGQRWDTVKEGQITFYHTTFPVYKNGTIVAKHNVYFRNDPRILEKKVEFKGELELTEMLVIEGLSNFSCSGYGIASEDSFEQVLNAWGTQVIQDPKAGCDLLGRYNFVKLVADNKTWIESYGPKCHVLHINNCEVFEAKERFLIQEFFNKNKK